MRVTSQAPCRVDLAGATLDIWPLYLFHEKPVTVNFAVNLYTRCEVMARRDRRIVLRSKDLRIEESFASLAELATAARYRLPIPALITRFFEPEGGVTIETESEAPAGAGISGSSALMISTSSALARYTGKKYSRERIREIAQNIEAQVIRVPTGAQDYYPALYGGVSAVELGPAGVVRTALPVDAEELNARFVLAYTGAPRNSGINNWEVMKGHIDGDKAIHGNFDKIAAIARAMRDALTRHDWEDAGRLMREEWSYRRKNIPAISTPLIDELVQVARRAGGSGAKVCGAGGGGCVVFLVPPGVKTKVAAALASAGAKILNAAVASRGVRVAGA